MPDCILEIKPTGKTTGQVVWEWHLWDHLVQDFDKTKANYGDVAKHPELVNINFGEDEIPATCGTERVRKAQMGLRRDKSDRHDCFLGPVKLLPTQARSPISDIMSS